MKPKILLVDNVPEFLETQARLLERDGYHVMTASSVTEAKELLDRTWIHLAIIDLRMEDENDSRDISGLVLAQERRFRTIPKIILTAYPDYESAVGALGPMEGYPSAIDYIAKQKGPEALADAVTRAFTHHVHINFSLTPDWKAANPLALVSRIEPGVENERERLVDRAEELQDLFRRLFYDWERIRIDRVLWQREGRIALTVFAFKGAAMDQFVVVCGQNALVVEEASRFDEFAPKAQGETSTTLADKAETTHFAANAYALARQADLETVRSLEDVYRAGDRKLFTQAVETLFEKTLAAWQPGPPLPAAHALEELYRARLGLTAERIAPQAVRARWQKLVQYVPELKTNVPDPEPIVALLQTTTAEQSTLVIKSPGMLTGDNILVDTNGRAWLTDFADAGDVPQFWNFVALESTIRFDWLEERELMRLQEVEACLLEDSHFGRPDLQEVESVAARQSVRFIQPIRRLAARAVGKEYWQYHLGIFFNAARRLADFDPAVPPMLNQRARLVHALLAMAQIAERFDKPNILPGQMEDTTLRLDKTNHRFELGARRVELTLQEFKLACYLFDNSGRTCTYQEILKGVFEGKYDEEYLQTMINRIRKKVEPDERSPRYILNVRSVGYRLVLNPEK